MGAGGGGIWVQLHHILQREGSSSLGGVCDGWGAALPRADVAMLKDATCLPLGLSGK